MLILHEMQSLHVNSFTNDFFKVKSNHEIGYLY